MRYFFLISCLYLISAPVLFSQNVAINTADTAGHPSAGLDINFINKGLLIPRVGLVSVLDTVTIPSPANSLLVFNTNTNMINGNGVGYYFYCATGCIVKGWKCMNFSDNGQGSGSEWTYYSRLTYNNSSAQQNFSLLPAHDKWKLVFDLQNNLPGPSLYIEMQLNDVTFYYYGTKYASQSPSYSNRWLIYRGVSGSDAFSGEMIITGKYFANQNSKTFSASLGGNNLYNTWEAVSGFLINDPHDINKISILTPQGAMTGKIELWYKDGH